MSNINMENVGTLNASQIAVIANIRHSIKPSRVASLAESIKLLGIQEPLHVYALPEGSDKEYGLLKGENRLAAAIKVEKDTGTPIDIPVIVVDAPDEITRLRLQITENNERENLSPMDMAHAIDQLLKAGMSKPDIRAMFSRPGGAKGNKQQPIANATLNMYHRFLEFPKDIQNKIHTGALGIHDAYKLHTKDRSKWPEILAEAEASRKAEAELEESDEKKFLESEAKLEAARQAQEAEQTAIKTAEEAAEAARVEAEAKVLAAANAYRAKAAAKDAEAKVKADAEFKAAETAAKAAEKAAEKAAKEAEALQKKHDARIAAAEEKRKKLEDARKASGNGGEETEKGKKGKLDIDRAAAKVTGSGYVKLTGPDLHALLAGLAKPSNFPKVEKIGKSLTRAALGELTEGQLLSELAYHTGERKQKPTTLKD